MSSGVTPGQPTDRLGGPVTNDFWAGKKTCFEMCRCPDVIQAECPSPRNRWLPCWEIEGTYCKLNNLGATGRDTGICGVCRVYRRYGENKAIVLRLFGQGMNASVVQSKSAGGPVVK